VLDKSVLVLEAVEAGASSLAALVERTGLSRATAHRLAVALEVHRLLSRDRDGRWQLGPRLGRAGRAALPATRCSSGVGRARPGCGT
jgi:DNA-binding IclR family transcriptional regulator